MREQAALIRCDASLSVGTGHVVRCLTLAGVLKSRGWRVTFAAREMPQPLRADIEGAGHDLIIIGDQDPLEAEPATIMRALTDAPPLLALVDHYDVGRDWEKAMAEVAPHVMAIDDLAEQPHAVSILLNQNLGYSPAEYDGLIGDNCRLLMGPGYALLRPQFSATRGSAPRVRDSVERILVFISGSDQHDVTGLAARAAADTGVRVDVVAGSAYPFSRGLETWARTVTNVTVHHNVTEMATLMHSADLSVGAPSSASWERCCLGLPTLLIGVAENQRRVASALAEVGAAQHLGWYDEVGEPNIVSAIERLRSDPSRLASMSRAAAAVTDGRGAEQVAEVIQSTVLHRESAQKEGHRGDIQTV